MGSVVETSVKLDLQKYLKILRHLELLPRPLGQDWSEIWLQRFSGTVTIWPKTNISDFWNILSDPGTERLARMIRAGEHSAWSKVRFIGNRLSIEKVIVAGLRKYQAQTGEPATQQPNTFAKEMQKGEGQVQPDVSTGWGKSSNGSSARGGRTAALQALQDSHEAHRRHSSILQEFRNQTTVFFDDAHSDDPESQTDAVTTEDEDDRAVGSLTGLEDNEAVLAGEEEGTRVD